MIETVLPETAAYAETTVDSPEPVLFGAEEALLSRAVDKRRREFGTARCCARSALADLGIPPAPILRGTRGEPCWPDGVVGSITHCDSYRAAAVARSEELRGIGIDAEPHAPLPERVLPTVSLPEERSHLRELGEVVDSVHWERLLFCAKECVYKSWFPITGSWLGFHDAVVTVDAKGGNFSVYVPGPAAAADGLALTALAVPH